MSRLHCQEGTQSPFPSTEGGHFLLGLAKEHVHYWVNKQFVIPTIVAGIR